jgi:hypothetical protein
MQRNKLRRAMSSALVAGVTAGLTACGGGSSSAPPLRWRPHRRRWPVAPATTGTLRAYVIVYYTGTMAGM